SRRTCGTTAARTGRGLTLLRSTASRVLRPRVCALLTLRFLIRQATLSRLVQRRPDFVGVVDRYLPRLVIGHIRMAGLEHPIEQRQQRPKEALFCGLPNLREGLA